jgi:membrane-associated phospholipid phosphatase
VRPGEHRPLRPRQGTILTVPAGRIRVFRPTDVLNLGYFGLLFSLIAILHDRVRDPSLLLVQFGLSGLGVLAIARLGDSFPDTAWIRLLRHVYPVLLLPATYKAIGRYVLVLRGHFVDTAMNAWESRVLGVHPNLLLERLASPAATEVLMFCYFCFYAYFVVPPVYFLVTRRYRHLESYIFALILPSYLCYLGFLVVPVLGPALSLREKFVEPRLPGYAFTSLVNSITIHGDSVGANFPSSHVAVAWSCFIATRQLVSRMASWIILPFNVGLTLATVYGRFHYVTDAVAGLMVATVCSLFAGALYPRPYPNPARATAEKTQWPDPEM